VEDLTKRIPELLESVTGRVRAGTVDRAARILTYLALGLLITVLVIAAVTFLLVGILRMLEEVIRKIGGGTYSMEIAYAVVGGLFLFGGALLWANRTRAAEPSESEK
jgi:hypothetical protein